MLDPIGLSQVDPEWEVLNDVRSFRPFLNGVFEM